MNLAPSEHIQNSQEIIKTNKKRFWIHGTISDIDLSNSYSKKLWKYSKKNNRLKCYEFFVQNEKFGYLTDDGKFLYKVLDYNCLLVKNKLQMSTTLKYYLCLTANFSMNCRSIDNGDQGQRNSYEKKFYSANPNDINEYYDLIKLYCLQVGFNSNYEIIEKIGQGHYASVYKVMSKKTNEYFAAKVASLNEDNIHEINKSLNSILQESKIYVQLNHSGIVKYHGIFISKGKIYILLEFITGGTLFERLLINERYTESNAAYMLKNLISALQYLISKNIAHRDIKLENILLVNLIDDCDIKLADFGFACKIGTCDKSHACGTPGFIAPEVLKGQGSTSKSDIFSAGIILYAVLSGTVPFQDKDLKKMLIKNRDSQLKFPSKYWSDISYKAQDLIKQMTNPNPDERIDIDGILNHPWMKSFTDSKDQLELKYYANGNFSTASASNIIQMQDSDKLESTKNIFFGPKLKFLQANWFDLIDGNPRNNGDNDDEAAANDNDNDDYVVDAGNVYSLGVYLKNNKYIMKINQTPFALQKA